MTVTPASFRTNYPEFADAGLYPDAGLAYQIGIAGLLLNASRWGNVLDVGTELFTAHNVVLERRAQAEAENGAVPGGSAGPVNSKSVDKVSVGYDTTAAIDDKAGHWNLTVYGTRFIKLAKMMGAGPVQVGLPGGGGLSPWSGPDCSPGWFGS